jgi:AcrR family transcriptional regulator
MDARAGGKGGKAADSSPSRPSVRANYHHGDLREALIRAAEELLDEVGPDGLKLREVARRAGVSHAAPAHHFHDLGGLLSEVAADGFERLAAAIAAASEAARAAGRDQLSATGRAYVDFALGHAGLFQLMFRSRTIDMANPRLAAAGDAAFDALRAAAAASRAAPDEGGDGRAHMAALVRLWSLVHGLAFLAIDGRLDEVLRTAGTDLGALTDAVVAPPPGGWPGV